MYFYNECVENEIFTFVLRPQFSCYVHLAHDECSYMVCVCRSIGYVLIIVAFQTNLEVKISRPPTRESTMERTQSRSSYL